MKKFVLTYFLITGFFLTVFAGYQNVPAETVANPSKKLEVRIFPNPVDDYLHVTGGKIDSIKVEVFNIIGNSLPVSVHKKTSEELLVSTSALPQGYYWLVLYDRSNGGKGTYRFMKQ